MPTRLALLSLALSLAALPAAGQHEHQSMQTASAMWVAPLASGGSVALTGIWGRNIEPASTSDSLTAEAQLDLDGRNVPFARFEWVQKLGHDLVVPGPEDAKYGVAMASIGYAHRFAQLGPVVPIVGGAIDLGYVPDELRPSYGTRAPFGAFVFIGLQPPRL